MSQAKVAMASRFDGAAETAGAAEAAYRKAAAIEIARLERARVVAFRRARLVRLLEEAACSADTPENGVKQQRARVCREFGWSGDAESARSVLDRLGPVCAIIADPHHADRESGLAAQLAAFEAWFEADRGVSVYALFDQYVQETPVVDF